MALTSQAATMSTGNAEIDHQHQQLIAHLNDLFELMHRGEGGKGLPELLGFLGRYAQTHFAHEEHCMEAYRCPAAGVNKAAHAEFNRFFAELAHRLHTKGPTTSLVLETQSKLSDWLKNHIVGIDTQLKNCIRAER